MRFGRHQVPLPRLLVAFSLSAALGACQTFGPAIPDQALDDASPGPFGPFRSSMNAAPRTGAPLPSADAATGASAPILVRGTNDLPAITTDAPTATVKNGEYVLNFDNVDIRDVLKAVLTDMLGINYIVDPAIQGTISLRTAKPLSRAAVLPAFEEALKLAGAALVPGSSAYQVVPIANAAQRGPIGVSGNSLGPGYQVRLVPLRYVTAPDVQRILEPLVPPGTVIPAGASNASLITLAGTASDVDRAERAIEMFDVNWLRSQSFGLFPLRYSSAASVAEGLNSVIGKQGPLAGVVRIVPIAHLNAILVVSKNYAHVEEMRTWVERFDRGRNVLKPRLFVYYVQNGRAKDLASVLTKALSQSRGGTTSVPTSQSTVPAGDDLAPATESPQPSSPGLSSPLVSSSGGGSGAVAASLTTAAGSITASTPDSSANDAGGALTDLRITADEPNNALLIMTTPERYAQVESALVRLDAAPLQVMLEASIAEVDLNDGFRYGVQVSLNNGAFSALSSAVAAAALGPSTGGLSAALLRSDIKATLDFLSNYTTVRVISAPKLMVLNNRTASLQVGDQVPIATSSSVSNITPNAPTVNSIQMYDTGIILRVTPRVNRNGRVLMDIAQEVSQSVPTTTSTLNSPTIQQRRVSTSVVVEDGQTVAIGGLIKDSRARDRTGVPWLKDIPGVGPLFGTSDDRIDRTELLVLIQPHVIRNAASADAATDELSAKLPMLHDNFRPSRRP
ncbi:type II secretion system secretin GspD [Bradyrhizobium sp. 179]|uniref:type II secretion system secretin GspD n=1 Tax=Bradyrhizobium sp. 179 TaxID=2782648 RepID=UPI001FFA862D|nr:type II secretion system secretin GspD [Bradyrhizobium sp. 179]MCK1545718.1 type II secretion system secretin GspD [Bradyrhizobium sp. 179]